MYYLFILRGERRLGTFSKRTLSKRASRAARTTGKGVVVNLNVGREIAELPAGGPPLRGDERTPELRVIAQPATLRVKGLPYAGPRPERTT